MKRLEDKRALKAEIRELTLARKIEDERAKITPWQAAPKIPIGEKQLYIANVLNNWNGAIEVQSLGQFEGWTFTRYNFAVRYVGNYPGNLTDFKEMLSSAAGGGTKAVPTFDYGSNSLFLDVPKDSRDRRYPKVEDFIGMDRTQILWPLGLDASGQFASVPMDSSTGHVSITGSTRSGKTESIRSICQFWSKRHTPDVIGFAFVEAEMRKNPTLQMEEWESVPHLVAPIAYSYLEALQVVGKFAREAIARGEEFRRRGVSRIEDYNKIPGVKKAARWVLFFDEAEVVLDTRKCPEVIAGLFLAMFLEFGREWAALGMTLAIGLKRLAAGDQELMPTQLRSVLDWLRVCYRVGTVQDSLIATQASEKEFLGWAGPDLMGSGDCIVRSLNKGGLTRYQQLYAENRACDSFVGDPDEMPDREVPSLEWILETFIVQSRELAGEVAQLTAKIEAAERMKGGAGSDSEAKEAAEAESKASKSDIPGWGKETEKQFLNWYLQYRSLRQHLNMTDAVVAIGNLPNKNSTKAYRQWQWRVDKSVAMYAADWIKDLPSDMSDEKLVVQLWGQRKDPEIKAYCLDAVRSARAELANMAGAVEDNVGSNGSGNGNGNGKEAVKR